MEKYVCIHGHFYQPPRENPWLGEIEQQPTAAPWHDWNLRIAEECYAPNTAVPVEGDDHQGEPTTFNNFSRISFDTGPTLLWWLARSRPDILEAIREADRLGVERFSGHGPALAQGYNHLIHPLAGRRDTITQIVWGISDFRYRFGRDPEGLWLPETAVDTGSLEAMAARGIRFTILGPHQAEAVRLIGSGGWTWLREEEQRTKERGADGFARPEGLDTSRPYLVRLPSGREISVFFFDNGIGTAVSFGGLLDDHEAFVERLLLDPEHDPGSDRPRLIHFATDGETFGHHVKGGEKTIARALARLESGTEANLTIYGEFLERFPPTHEVMIAENTSWSCPHGVERWRSDCGCAGGRYPGGNQTWRLPLREALDWLRDSNADMFERETGRYFMDPWRARDSYVDVLLDPSEESVTRFLSEQSLPGVTQEEARKTLPFLEIQRYAMLMYTSCGWFFDDPGDIETVQILRYAGMVIQIARARTGTDLEPGFLSILRKAVSNEPERGDGATIYERHVRPFMEMYPVGES
ncbi:DUF3536 domain-containing protein [Gemmatimonadota bacterium]